MLNGKIHAKRASRTKLTAQQWEAEERKRIEAGPLETLTISFGSLAERYFDNCRARMQQNTRRSKSHYYAKFIDYLNGNPPAQDISKTTFLNYLEHIQSTEGNKTANRHLKDLKALYDRGLLHDLVTGSWKRIFSR
ncbi:phage integrase N-terminal SAM-like domain-containing protein [Desulforhabdus sp. TSK]|uniref:phage integrase N-terminal SAM-like domain-containing protein n=1 Tax=Desulforhabdus sp. TSK TaxID=2925014 RepID=UPI001FC8102E|nr:phage integrase N-terminal SAM-like domain-containing protein [Desulforhabdus sp. TSK]